MHQFELKSLRAFIEVGNVALVSGEYVNQCRTLTDALWLSKSPALAGRTWTQRELAEAIGVCPSTINKVLNGSGFSQQFLPRWCFAVGNALPLQWMVKQIGGEVIPAKVSRIQQLERELAELKATA